MKHLFALIFSLSALYVQGQSIVYVTKFGSGNQTGSSWANALPNSQLTSRLSGASAGTQFWIAGGNYQPTSGTDYSISFFIPSGVQVYGGFTGNEATLNDRILSGPSSTTFTGNIGDLSSNEDNSRHVVQFRNASSSTRLDGIVVTGGYASLNSNGVGGGVYNDGSSGGTSNPTLANCIVTNNFASSDGANLFNNGYQGNSSPYIVNCIFSNGRANQAAGGAYNNGYQGRSNPTYLNCLFNDNISANGGAIFNEAFQGVCQPTFTNCTIARNQATARFPNGSTLISSGAIYNHGQEGTCAPVLLNCIIWDNYSSGEFSGAIYNNPGNTTINYSDIQDGGYAGNGNVSVNPLFTSPSDFRLKTGSPVINTGDPASNVGSVSATDLAGKSRIQQNRIDMGAYEYQETPDRIYVTPTGAGNQSGSSWTNALPGYRLRATLAAAAERSVFWLAAGSYNPGILRTETFLIPSGVQVYGGFNGSETDLSSRILSNPSSTTLTGEVGDPAIIGDNNQHVVTFTNASSSTRLDGVVITGGNADGNGGGGIVNDLSFGQDKSSNPTIINAWITNNDGSGFFNKSYYGPQCNPVLENCIFSNNRSKSGGALYNSAGSTSTSRVTLINCRFENNATTNFDGGAIFNDGFEFGSASIICQNCQFFRNSSVRDGGAIYSSGTSGTGLTLTNCVFSNNSAVNNGGAIYQSASFYGVSTITITNSLFTANSSQNGGAVYNKVEKAVSNPTLKNCTFINNTAQLSGSVIFSQFTQQDHGSCKPSLINCVARQNLASANPLISDNGSTTSIFYSNIQGGFSGTGNIDQDPQFVDAANGNYRLKAGSPCINTGDPASTAATVSEKDLDGNPRIAENRIDMGVYEFQLTSQPTADLSLSLQVSNRTPNPNQPISYILTVTNNGPSPATNVIWQNRLPDNLTFVGGDNVSATNGILSGQIGSLTSGASASFTYQLRPTQSGRYVNAAQLTFADQPDPDSQPDSGTGDGQDDAAAIEIRTANGDGPVFVSANPNQVPLPPLQSNQPTPDPNKIDLSLALSVSNRSPRVGDLLTYTLVVNNRGGATASTVNVMVYLPNGQSFDSSDSLTPTGEALSGGVNTLAPGAQAVFIYKTRATQPGAAITRAQIRQASPPDVDSTPDNGTENGEDDTAQISIRTVSN